MKQLTFRKAEPDEIKTVLSYLKEAALWLRGKGIDYWQDWIDPASFFTDWIQQGFDEDQFYIVQMSGKDIGCFRLQWQDPMFWGEQDDNAGYIHSFTISRELAGKGIGAKVLELIEGLCREHNRSLLRLDCGVDVKDLRRYYESLCFQPVGEVSVKGERLTLYEKSLIS
ncbi:MAG: GNAT family N-acetyltransferase [Cyanobacteria bacterium P01_F01_bin.86]